METMDYKEAAQYLHINAGTLRNWVSQGKFIKPLKRQGAKGRVLFLKSEVETWLEDHAQRKLERASEGIVLDQEKTLFFSIKLFNDDSSIKKGILAQIKDFGGNDDSFMPGLSGSELRAVAKAFLECARLADEREQKG